MLSQLYLTPASISYLTQFILSLAITFFLLNRLRSQRARSLLLLTTFFVLMTAFTGLMILDAALLPFPRILPAYAENTVLALVLVVMIWFAYQFPERYPERKWEMRILLTLSIIFLLFEAGFMVYRYISLIRDGNVFNRFPLDAYSLPVVVLFVPVAFLRQTLAADPRPVAWWRKLWKPEGRDARGARNFVLVFAVPVVVGIVSVLLNFGLPFEIFNAAVSIGILLMLWLFATNYIDFIPGSVTVASRLSILMLTLFLALIGTVGWLIAPSYIATFEPDLRDHQTLRFTPNPAGGYHVSEVDFHFESALGEKVRAQTLDENGNQRVEFTFPYYGETYTEAYITESGAISLGEPFRPLNLQAAVASVPTLFPLKLSLYPNPAEEDSGLFIQREPERLIVTWNRLLASRSEIYTFQSILYADGTFEFTNNGLPQPILYSSDSTPWLRGAVAGHGEPLHEPPAGMEKDADLIAISRTGTTLLLENHLLAFRRYLHTFMLPAAWVVIGGSLLILLIIPLLLRSSIAQPLEALTAGVRRMETGEMDITIPVQTEDEIGFLTGAFNSMSDALDNHVRNLETSIANRTAELADANSSLRSELLQREAAQEQLLQHQSAVAAFEERERLARELHDSIGQTFGYVNMQSDAIRELIGKGNRDEALHMLTTLSDVAVDAHRDLRAYIQGLKSHSTAIHQDFFAALERYCKEFEESYLFHVRLNLPETLPTILASSQVETHLTYIIREALSNARRYSGQKEASLTIKVDDEFVYATVEDRGTGFDSEYRGPERRKGTHFGMMIMRERAEEVGGGVTIDSAPSKGTRVIIRLPRKLTMEGSLIARVLLVDDHPLFMDGLRNMLVTRGVHVIGMAQDGLEAYKLARELKPDIILMDISMPRMSGLEATRQIKMEMPEVKVVILTTSTADEDVFEALQVGASGYFPKGMAASEFMERLAEIARGESQFSAQVADQLLESFAQRNAGAVEMTERQTEILRLVARGMTYREIGDRLYLTERTVKYHMGEILARLHLKRRQEAEEYARRHGLT